MKYNGNVLFKARWIKKGIVYIADVQNDDGGLKKYNDFTEIFEQHSSSI